jgi:bifunctional non-homologous end joining protein LigD
VVTTAFTTQEKQELYEELVSRRAEGIVFKKKNSVYTAGRPNSGGNQLKFKFYKTATFIVKDYTPGRRSVGLEVLDNGKRISVGRVTIPPNKNVPNIGDLIEVRYLYAYKGGSVYQPVYLGVRTDLDLQDADINQLVYKAGTEEDDDI